MLPAYPQSPASQLHPPQACQQDRSLQQLVLSRMLQDPPASPTCLVGTSRHPSPHHKGMSPKAGKHQQPAVCKLTKQRSGNPFASKQTSAEVEHTDLEQQATSLLHHAFSGNPFAEVATAATSQGSQYPAAGQADGGYLPIDNKGNSASCLEGDMMSSISAGSSAHKHTRSSVQQAFPSCAGPAASHPAAACLLKNLEMSPLQNGLIRCA